MNKNEYDVIVIGAGIAGLVCASYLTKSGMRVLLIEKNIQPGGYCRSLRFGTNSNVRFDTCVHSLSSCRENGLFGKIISELGLNKRLALKQHDVPDIVDFEIGKVSFYRNISNTVASFSEQFPNQKIQIKKFFDYIYSYENFKFLMHKNKTFDEFLKEYFDDSLLRKVISIPILISSGYFTCYLSAFVGCAVLREHILDGGYYPVGGVQALPNSLKLYIEEHGGEILFSKEAKKILIENNKINGVLVNNGLSFYAKKVVSCCDIQLTLTKLISNKEVNIHSREILEEMHPSLSAFCLYLTLSKELDIKEEYRSTMYFTNKERDISDTYNSFLNYDNNSYLVTSPTIMECGVEKKDKVGFLVITNTYFNDIKFWQKNKKNFGNKLLGKLCFRNPDIGGAILKKGMATPIALGNWTYNYKGASSGWASVPKQLARIDLNFKNRIKGLYFAGHWVTQSHGIVSAAYTGKKVAQTIILQK